MDTNNSDDISDLDRATADRLAKLRSMPVDLGGLKTGIDAQLRRAGADLAVGRFGWIRSLRTMAAGVLLLALVGAAFLMLSGGPVEASTLQMAQMHEDIVAGRTPTMRVDSIDAANRMLANGVRVPNVPSEHVMACCMKSVKDKQIACVVLDNAGDPITLTVANARDVKPPTCPAVMCNGIECHVMRANGLNMVMTQRDGRWACLIGRASSTRLMDIASKLEL
jgi:hypothetical protein